MVYTGSLFYSIHFFLLFVWNTFVKPGLALPGPVYVVEHLSYGRKLPGNQLMRNPARVEYG